MHAASWQVHSSHNPMVCSADLSIYFVSLRWGKLRMREIVSRLKTRDGLVQKTDLKSSGNAIILGKLVIASRELIHLLLKLAAPCRAGCLGDKATQ